MALKKECKKNSYYLFNQNTASCGLNVFVIVNLELKYFFNNSTFLILAISALSTVFYNSFLVFFLSSSSFFSASVFSAGF